jgi:hypothetical protein
MRMLLPNINKGIPWISKMSMNPRKEKRKERSENSRNNEKRMSIYIPEGISFMESQYFQFFSWDVDGTSVEERGVDASLTNFLWATEGVAFTLK